MSLEPCVCTQGFVMCYQIICMRKHKAIHCISRLLWVSIATDSSICGWFTITFLPLFFPPMQICEGLTQAPLCQPGNLSRHGKGRGNKPHWAKGWPSLVFPWIKEGAAKLAKLSVQIIMRKDADEGNEPSNGSWVLFCLSEPEFREMLDAHEHFRREDILETCLSWKSVDVVLVWKLHSSELTSIEKYSYYIFSFSVAISSTQWLFPCGANL